VQLYAGRADPKDPRLDLLNIDPAGLPPILLQAGGLECLAAESEVFSERVVSAGGDCELQVWPGQVHVFQGGFRVLPEANAAIDRIGRFVFDILASSAAAAFDAGADADAAVA
jgi:acetyl esterase/lipase